MATKKRDAKRKTQFICKKCKTNAGSPTGLSQHYKKHPSHRPMQTIYQQRARENQRAKQAALAVGALPTEPIPTRSKKADPEASPKRRKRWNFCPNCGHSLNE